MALQRRKKEDKIISEKGVFMLNSYGDLEDSLETVSNSISVAENCKPLKPAYFYRAVSDGSIMLGLPIRHETASSNVAGEELKVFPSSCSHCDVVGYEPGSADISTTYYYSARNVDLTLVELSTKYVDAWDGVKFDAKTQLNVEDGEGDDDDDDEEYGVVNREEFDRLEKDPRWDPFFRQYSDLELGDLIAKGGQAKVYAATGKEIDIRDSTGKSMVSTEFVVKVFGERSQLSQLKRFWPKGLVAAAIAHRTRLLVPYVCWALGAQLLEDNRFAFVFPRLNADLRQRIDAAMEKRNGRGPPFSPFVCFCIISDIAAGMAYLHGNDLLHHDLKAANVLDLRNVCEDQTCIMMLVADFESSEGIQGTGWWRAPEILKKGKPSEPIPFSKAADVYSFAMTCYEVATGYRPFDLKKTDSDGIINRNERPELPLNICPELKDLICRCWSADPHQRPSFDTIRTDLIEYGRKHSTGWNVIRRYKTLNFFYESDYLKEKKGVEDDEWEWPIYYKWKSEETGHSVREFKRERKFKNFEWKCNAPFEVTFVHEEHMPSSAIIRLHSPHLIQIAKDCLPLHAQYFDTIDEPVLDARDMFIALQAFKVAHEAIKQDHKNASKDMYLHSKHLLRFLEKHFNDTSAEVQRVRREMKVTFHLLWAFLYKGERVYYTCKMTGKTLKGIVSSNTYSYNRVAKKNYFEVELECRDYNGWNYVTGSVAYPLADWSKSEKSFDSLGICPMRLLEQSRLAELEAMFLLNGKKFYNIVAQGSTYMHYEGPRIWYFTNEDDGMILYLKKQKADGRVMVDVISFARTNPDYVYLGNAEPPNNRNIRSVPHGGMPNDEELMLAPAVVYGFSFSNKRWGGFEVNGFSEVHFDNRAFDQDLVLTDPEMKVMILALVNQCVKDPSADKKLSQINSISNKGGGCIFLCYGPQGTGKTLTVESIAERLHCPLWSVSVSELGVTAKDLEKNLMEILDIASQWRAVLLLDEADLYLNENGASNTDANRIGMAAIFLRALERYRGVLFLTTNRVACFDEAFCSRISMFLRYHPLNDSQREKIWRTHLTRAQIKNPDLTLLRDSQLNGREIRNFIQIAQALARSSREKLTTDHVLRVIHMSAELRQDLEDGITEETDEQSICENQAGSWSEKHSLKERKYCK